MNSVHTVGLIAFGTLILISPAVAADGDPTRGQRLFGACAACHSLEPNRNMTGPSLSNLWNRKAGSLSNFPRYSPALKSTDVVWGDKTLGEYIKDPQRFIPGNTMTFAGIVDAQLGGFLIECGYNNRSTIPFPKRECPARVAPRRGLFF